MTKIAQMMEYMIQDVVDIMSEVQAIEFDKAMDILYNSQVYDKIMDKETGLYRESPAYVYGLLQDELNFGRIVQTEV